MVIIVGCYLYSRPYEDSTGRAATGNPLADYFASVNAEKVRE